MRDHSEVAPSWDPDIRGRTGVGEASDTFQSLAKGERVAISPPDTIADGLRSPMPGKITFPIVQEHVEKIILVSEDEIRATVRFLLERMKILVEPSGAVAPAAVLFGKLPQGIRSAGVVISGGNVDLNFLAGPEFAQGPA
jgi:threonine dehydratase